MKLIYSLQVLAKGKTILVVEDNKKLRAQLQEFLERLFSKVYVAEDVQGGFSIFNKFELSLIITDIELPNKNGLEMVKNIRMQDTQIPIIIMSAYDQKEYLLQSINYGISSYVKKPAKITLLTEILFKILHKQKEQKEKQLFEKYTHAFFEKENALIILFEKHTPLLVNPAFLEFFGVQSLEKFYEIYGNLGNQFLRQEGFIDNSAENCFEKITQKPGSYFHVKMSTQEKKPRHFLTKYISIGEKDQHYGVVILDDITSLGLLSLYNEFDDSGEKFFGDIATMQNAINMLIKQESEIKVYNYYKGLSITNSAKIIYSDQSVMTFQTNMNQLRASKYEKHIIISSDALPNFIWCDEIVDIDYDKQLITVANLKFMRSNPTKRTKIRIVPEADSKISLIFKLKEFMGTIDIVDLSVDGIKLRVNSLLVGMREGEPIEALLSLARKGHNLHHLHLSAKIFRIDKYHDHFNIALSFDINEKTKNILTEYISKRQVYLIREFKTLQ